MIDALFAKSLTQCVQSVNVSYCSYSMQSIMLHSSQNPHGQSAYLLQEGTPSTE